MHTHIQTHTHIHTAALSQATCSAMLCPSDCSGERSSYMHLSMTGPTRPGAPSSTPKPASLQPVARNKIKSTANPKTRKTRFNQKRILILDFVNERTQTWNCRSDTNSYNERWARGFSTSETQKDLEIFVFDLLVELEIFVATRPPTNPFVQDLQTQKPHSTHKPLTNRSIPRIKVAAINLNRRGRGKKEDDDKEREKEE